MNFFQLAAALLEELEERSIEYLCTVYLDDDETKILYKINVSGDWYSVRTAPDGHGKDNMCSVTDSGLHPDNDVG